MKEISKIILFDLGKTPEEINFPKFPSLPNNKHISDEFRCYKSNGKLFEKAYNSFAGAANGYHIIMQ